MPHTSNSVLTIPAAPAHEHSPRSVVQQEITGAEILVQCLLAEGVDVVFGYPGGANIGIYDALYASPELKHVLVRHEQGATHAAEGYAKATGKPGVVLVTSGPGATNTVTGIADAFMDSIPIVVFTGQVALRMIGNDAFQEVDIIGITRPVTKHSYLVRDVNDLARVVKEAFHIASTGRPGPVLVDLPKDVMAKKAVFSYPDKVEMRTYKPVVEGNAKQIKKAAALINGSRRPVLYVGGGAIRSDASKTLFDLAVKLGCPVTTTLHGLGAFPETHPLALGMLGMHGTWYSNMAVSECDLLIAVGARFDDRVTGNVNSFANKAKKIHIDIDPACIGKNVRVDVAVVGDVKSVLHRLTEHLGTLDTGDWLGQISEWKKAHPLRYVSGGELRAQHVIHVIGELTNGKAVVVSDVGQHQMWTAQFINWMYPRTHLTSGGLGTMGFSLPAAMGAAFGRSDYPVISLSGDGGFQMNSQELATIVEYKLPLKIFVINNGYLGMVRQWQELFWERRYSHVELANPDFVKLAEAYGCRGLRVNSIETVRGAVQEALDFNDGPILVEFVVAKEDNVYPMMPAGQTVNEMMDTPDPLPHPSSHATGGIVTLSKG